MPVLTSRPPRSTRLRPMRGGSSRARQAARSQLWSVITLTGARLACRSGPLPPFGSPIVPSRSFRPTRIAAPRMSDVSSATNSPRRSPVSPPSRSAANTSGPALVAPSISLSSQQRVEIVTLLPVSARSQPPPASAVQRGRVDIVALRSRRPRVRISERPHLSRTLPT